MGTSRIARALRGVDYRLGRVSSLVGSAAAVAIPLGSAIGDWTRRFLGVEPSIDARSRTAPDLAPVPDL